MTYVYRLPFTYISMVVFTSIIMAYNGFSLVYVKNKPDDMKLPVGDNAQCLWSLFM